MNSTDPVCIDLDQPGLTDLAYDLCMQVAAANPRWLAPADVPADVLAKEREIYREQLKTENKPEAIHDTIIAGKLDNRSLRIADSTISNNIAKKVFEALWNGEGATADEIIDRQGLKQITDAGAIEAIVDEVLAANPASVAEFKAGKEKAFNALVGQVMKAARGKANPQQVNELLRRKLAG